MPEKQKSEREQMEDLRAELVDYVQLRKRLRRPLTFAEALKGHRQVCDENAFQETDGFWATRRRLCERLMVAEGIMPLNTPEIAP